MKTNLDKLFKTDPNLEQNGVWFDINDEVGFLLRPFKPSNTKVKAALAKHYKPFAKQVELGSLDDMKALEIHIKMFIDACLVDWKGVVIDDEPAECTPEIALKFFKNLPDLFETLQKHAGDFNSYREDVGNS